MLQTTETPGCGGRRDRGQTRTWLARPGQPDFASASPLPALRTAETRQATVRLRQVPPRHTRRGRAAENHPAVHPAAGKSRVRCPAEPSSAPKALSPSLIFCPWNGGGHMTPYDIGFRPRVVLPLHSDQWHWQSPASGRLSGDCFSLKHFLMRATAPPEWSRGPHPTRHPWGLPLEPRLLL